MPYSRISLGWQLTELDPQSGLDSCHQRNKNKAFVIILALTEGRSMTARGKDAREGKMQQLYRECRAGRDSERAEGHDHKQTSA